MAMRLLEVHVSESQGAAVAELLADASSQECWQEPGGAYGCVVKAVLGAGRTGSVIDRLYELLSGQGAFRLIVLPVDAVLPRPHATASSEGREDPHSAAAVSREEVYSNVSAGAELSLPYVALAMLSATVAAIGLANDNTAAVIGAMVVAPLLGPNMSLSLGLTLADTALLRRAAWTNVVGFSVALGTSILLGLVLQVHPDIPEIASRTRVGLGDMLLALAAGCAGTLAFTSGAPAFLVGVMVAVALLPPTVAVGLLASGGHTAEALRALLLVSVNVVAINLASVLTFLWRGMRPRLWWQAEPARRSARVGVVILVALLMLLGALVQLARRVA